MKGLTFGSWWNDVGEYEKAAQWITRYLTVYDKDARGHKMLGEVYERLEKTDRALNCYKNSLRVKQDQVFYLKILKKQCSRWQTIDIIECEE